MNLAIIGKVSKFATSSIYNVHRIMNNEFMIEYREYDLIHTQSIQINKDVKILFD